MMQKPVNTATSNPKYLDITPRIKAIKKVLNKPFIIINFLNISTLECILQQSHTLIPNRLSTQILHIK